MRWVLDILHGCKPSCLLLLLLVVVGAILHVVVVVDGVVVGIVVSVVVVEGAHLTNYCPLEQPSGFC